jgi:hypothetical protein
MAYISNEPIIYKYANLELEGDTWTDTLKEIKNDLNKMEL